MKKIIVSDLHGCGDVYDSIMAYLENLSLIDDVELYINGDLIDRGPDSLRILLDVFEKIKENGHIKINYLGGNHELMMYNALKRRKPCKRIFPLCDWMLNGGWVLEKELNDLENREELCRDLLEFIGELKIYHLFDEEISSRKILLVHAQAPFHIKHQDELRIKDRGLFVKKAVWTRKEENDSILYGLKEITGLNRIGLDNYFTIIGHTPVQNKNGFIINSKENYINIDGGCAGYAIGKFQYRLVPIIEVDNNSINILLFNHNNQIEKGFTYNGKLSEMSNEDLQSRRLFLNPKYNHQEKQYKQKILEIYGK